MPGASLWLVPPKSHHDHLPHLSHHGHSLHLPHLPGSRRNSREIPKTSHSRHGSQDQSKTSHHQVHDTLTHLIDHTVPSIFSETPNLPTFIPHVTLTSDIDLFSLKPNPSAWLERLAIPQVEDVKVKFQSVEVGQTFTKKLFVRCEKSGLEGLGELCRWQAVESPGGISGDDGRNRAEAWAEGIWDPHLSLMYSDAEVSEEKRHAVQNEVIKSGITLDGNGDMSGWIGGIIMLVDTNKPIDQWKPIAERKLVAEWDV